MAKEVYQGGYFLSHFSDLLRILAERTGRGDEFIAVQDELLNEIGDKASHEAQVLLQCKIAFYRNTDQPGKAAEIVESNLQIEAFRKEAVERRIALGKYAEAKALIAEIWEKYQDYRRRPWDKLLLTIAQKENDIPAIRRIAGEFIAGRFDRDYYDIYKSAFSPEEWKTEVEKLLDRYRKDTRELRWETDSVAEVLAAEQKTERLLRHVGQHLSAEKIAHYHERFAKRFPAETLALFEKAIDKYAEENLGCSSYEYVAKLLQQMRKIEGGGAIVAKMLARYRTQYKRRRAMIETLNRL
ncbi:MAG: hypothetical protein LBS70_01190 [Candidatus Accumulibacter sp.]|nr:hypothetical protein [Accumulibacter sp.]